jgi:hypothetical protein
MESILLSIKKALSIDSEYDGFDEDIKIGINGAFFNINQLGIGPTDIFSISGIDEVWTDFLDTATDLEIVKNYILLKTRMFFDPPSSEHMNTALSNQIKELEWRMMIYKDPEIPDEEEEVV